MRAPRQLAALLFVLLLPVSSAHAHDEVQATLARLDSLARARPDDLAPRLRHAELSRLIGDPKSARADLDAIESRSPRHPGAYLLEAALASDTQQFAEAERWIDRFLAISDGESDATVARALVLRAEALAAQGNTAAAIADYDRAFATAPAPHADWALARANLAPPDEALAGLERALVRLPDEPSLVFRAAELEAARGQVDDGAHRLQRFAGRFGGGEAILARAGDLYAQNGRRFDAEAQWTEALRLIEQDRNYRNVRAKEDLRSQLVAKLSFHPKPPLRYDE
jgi:tetratricopeptide (TPR) repeat protein